MSEKKVEYAAYVSTKIDVELTNRLKAAAALAGKTSQEWLSDLVNGQAAKELNLKPIHRKSPPTHPKRPRK